MSRGLAYLVLMSSRDGGKLLESTLKSLTQQTVPPKKISISIDGGDVDSSIETIQRSCRTPYIIIEHRGEEYVHRDVRRMPGNLNEAYREAIKKLRVVDFLLISGDDCRYPREYAETLMQCMLRDGVSVASGMCTPTTVHPLREIHPTGSGRMIGHEYWLRVGAAFPISYGWEAWLVYQAEMEGEKVKVYPDLRFEHMHPRGRTHGFSHWGKARYLLGFHPLYMLGRTILDISGKGSTISKKGTMKMLLGYITAPLLFKLRKDPYARYLEDTRVHALRRFIHQKQLKIIKEKLISYTKAR